jgi:hypothetical protein
LWGAPNRAFITDCACFPNTGKKDNGIKGSWRDGFSVFRRFAHMSLILKDNFCHILCGSGFTDVFGMGAAAPRLLSY